MRHVPSSRVSWRCAIRARNRPGQHTSLRLRRPSARADDLIRYKDEEIERLKDMKVRLSTKMVGESLEQHCRDRV